MVAPKPPKKPILLKVTDDEGRVGHFMRARFVGVVPARVHDKPQIKACCTFETASANIQVYCQESAELIEADMEGEKVKRG